MQLQYERQLHKREMETAAARQEAAEKRNAKLRCVAATHKRNCIKWEAIAFKKSYHALSQPVFSASNTSSVTTSSLTDNNASASSIAMQPTTSKTTVNLVAKDLHISSDDESVTLSSASTKLQNAQSKLEAIVKSSRLPEIFLVMLRFSVNWLPLQR